MEFPKRIYTIQDIRKASGLVKMGYKHHLKIRGTPVFKEKVEQALRLIRIAGYYDFFRKYIRSIVETDGLTQLRETEVAIWANEYAVQDHVDAASLFVQKANHMKEYLQEKLYFGGAAETRSVKKRIEFLQALERESRNDKVKERCEMLLRSWSESTFL